jgi:hypothetical protein
MAMEEINTNIGMLCLDDPQAESFAEPFMK